MKKKLVLFFISICYLINAQNHDIKPGEPQKIAKYTLGPRFYQAVYTLNTILVRQLLAEYGSLTLEEKNHVLTIIRRRVDFCNDKTLTASEKIERVMHGTRLVFSSFFWFYLANVIHRVQTRAFAPREEPLAPEGEAAEVLEGVRNTTGGVVGAVAHFMLGDGVETQILNILWSELTTETGLIRLKWIFGSVGAAYCLTGIYKAASLGMEFGRDQDAKRAEEIEYLVSSMPLRSKD